MTELHRYISNSNPLLMKSMLQEIGIVSIDELFSDIPKRIRDTAKLNLPSHVSEANVRRKVEAVLGSNLSTKEVVSFLGAGVWPHYVPAAVDAILSRGEFLTSYTPYQPEISQGMLQAMFEYQSLICELTEMEYEQLTVRLVYSIRRSGKDGYSSKRTGRIHRSTLHSSRTKSHFEGLRCSR